MYPSEIMRERVADGAVHVLGLTLVTASCISLMVGVTMQFQLGMVLACDVRVAVSKAKAFYPVMKLGFLPQPSDPGRLVELVGPARAKMILMAGAKIDTDTALAWGLFDRIVEADALMDTAKELAADTIGATPEHAAAIKRMCQG